MILLPYCFFGKLTTESFAQMCDCIYDLNWLHLSVGLQKSIILMIASMQEPMFYHGFKIVTLDLNTLVRVSRINQVNGESRQFINAVFTVHFQLLRTVVSYFMMFKTMAMQ